MKKYFYIFKFELKSNLSYITNILFGFIGYAIMIYILLNLWEYTYSDPNELINGYSMNQMIWYIVITEILWSTLGGRKLCRNISNDVKSGNISYNINKPYSYIGYVISSNLGQVFIKFITYIILGIFLGYIFIGSFPSLNILSILAVILSSILATFISILAVTTIGLLSFYIEDSTPFYWLYSKVILLLGVIFPIEYFPAFIQPILKYSLVYVVSYGPAKLYVDFSTNTFISILIAQVIYLIIVYLLCSFIYKKGVKKLNVNGG